MSAGKYLLAAAAGFALSEYLRSQSQTPSLDRVLEEAQLSPGDERVSIPERVAPILRELIENGLIVSIRRVRDRFVAEADGERVAQWRAGEATVIDPNARCLPPAS